MIEVDELLLDKDALRRNDPRAMNELFIACNKFARIGARASRVPNYQNYVDDVAQDMAMHVLNKFLNVYDGVRDVSNYLIDVAKKMTSGYSRKAWRERTSTTMSSEDGELRDMQFDAVDEAMASSDEEAELAEIEESALLAKTILLDRMRAKREDRALQSQRDKAGHEPVATKQVKQLLETKERLGLTFEQVEVVTGLSRQTLIRAGERGALGEKEVCAIQKVEGAEAGGGFDATRPIWEQMRLWCKRLGVSLDHPSWHVELSEVIGVHRATAYRWRFGKTQPPPHVLRDLDAVVEGIVRSREVA